MSVVKKLTKHGNSFCLILDKALVQLVGIESDTLVEISTEDGKELIIKPINDEETIEKYNKRKEKTKI